MYNTSSPLNPSSTILPSPPLLSHRDPSPNPPRSSKSSKPSKRSPSTRTPKKEIPKREIIKKDSDEIISLNDQELVSYYLVKYILSKHELTVDEINFGSNYICSFYDHSCQTNGPFTYHHLVQFLVYANIETICKFALSYNTTLDLLIQNRDLGSLRELLLGPAEMFVELYDNPFLNKEEFDYIQSLLQREFEIVRLELVILKDKIPHQEIIHDLNTCHSLEIQFQRNYAKDSNNLTILMNKCYNEVCFTESLNTIETTLSKSEIPANSIYTIDASPNDAPQIYCFKLLELLDLIIQPIPINPHTRQPFSSYSLNLINQRFHKEIAMYRRYKQLN